MSNLAFAVIDVMLMYAIAIDRIVKVHKAQAYKIDEKNREKI